jgi:co-chaperonin GroES (HSP10)
MIRPRGDLVLLEMDAEDRQVAHGLLIAPDGGALRFCKRCGTMMEKLDETPGCRIEEEYTLDERKDQYRVTDRQQRHDIKTEYWPTAVERGLRAATVLAVGVKVERASKYEGIEPGARVYVSASAGRFIYGSQYRIVKAEVIQAIIEGE